MRVSFSAANTESDVEQFFLAPLLTGSEHLSIPEGAIRSKPSLETIDIDKGRTRKRYVPDYIVYSEGFPLLVIEAKRPDEDLDDGYAEAQLYAFEINKRHRSEKPVQWVLATNGRELFLGKWDESVPTHKFDVARILAASRELATIKSAIGWDALQVIGSKLVVSYLPTNWSMPSEVLGENRVTLAKAGHNSLYQELEPILRRYFNSKDKEHEDEIIKNAYVNTEDTTKYERTFEDFLRTRIIPAVDVTGAEISTSRRSAPQFSKRLENLADQNQAYMQLLIGSVGAGKTSFLKRYFNYIIDEKLKQRIVYCRINFNNASDDLADIRSWVCQEFISTLRENFSHIVDASTEEGLQSIFSKEIKDNAGAYSLMRKSSQEKYFERLANDTLQWMGNPETFARALARSVGGDRGLTLVIAFDNVDRREREAQLKIFQTGQWFMNLTRAVCVMSLRDETFEVYKDEKPLDAFLKTGNFYIRPPRFVDMVSKRLNLVLTYLSGLGGATFSYEIDGLGKVTYPATSLGSYLTAVYVDLFQKKRRITLILEGLSGKNARKSLEMFGSVLTSAHFDTREFTNSALTSGAHRIQEATLLKALMRTNYLFFKPGHGFVRNIYDFPLSAERPSHFIKFEVLKFLIDSRKKMGDTRYEGYFTTDFVARRLSAQGFVAADVVAAINDLLADELIMSEELTQAEVKGQTAIRVRSSGYIHLKILSQRIEYIAACALVTPIAEQNTMKQIGNAWQISDPHVDVSLRRKREAATAFVEYLKSNISSHHGGSIGVADGEKIGSLLVRFGSEALGFSVSGGPLESTGAQEREYDRLFAE